MRLFPKNFQWSKKWSGNKESDTEWEAEFKVDKIEYSANFLNDGIWMETEHEIMDSEVPEVIVTSLKSNFPYYKIEESKISETRNGMVYEFAMEKGKSEMEVSLDGQGNVIKKEVEEYEEND